MTSSVRIKRPWKRRRRSRMEMGILIFSAYTMCLSSPTAAALDAVALPANTDNNDDITGRDSFSSDSFLDRVQKAITDASRPLHQTTRQRNTQSRWGPRLKKWKSTLSEMLTLSSAVSHAVVTISPQEKDTAPKIPRKRPQRTISDTGDMFDSEMHEGAKLISASFGLLSNTFGLLADGVRIGGDTAAGFVGSSVRLMGTTIKSVSGTFEIAGKALEPKMKERRKVLTSERLRERKTGKGDVQDDYSHGHIIRNTRSVASQSVRLVGNVLRGAGDILLLAGEATETIASSTTGVVEDVVRLVEDFAGSVSSALSPRDGEKRRVEAKVKIDSIRHKETATGIGDAPSFVTFGSYAVPLIEKDEGPSEAATEKWHKIRFDEKSLKNIVEDGVKEFWKLVEFTMADTQGVPSFAGELLGVMILCYLAAIWVISLSSKESDRPAQGSRGHQSSNGHQNLITHVVLPTSEDEISELSDLHESGAAATGAAGRTRAPRIDRAEPVHPKAKVSCCTWFLSTVLLPFRILAFLLSMARRTIFNKLMLLFLLYGGAWVYLCRGSQLRSSAIQRNAIASGYRAAIDSIGSSSHSVSESVAWLNALLNRIWRVPYDKATEEGAEWANLSEEFPKFVRRAIRANTYGRVECRSCDWDGTGPQLFSTSACQPYGGLEPYISSKIGTLLLEALGGSRVSRRSDVAYASLYSFTLGNKPPLVRSVEFLGASHDRRKLHFNVEVDATLEDLSLVLEVKLSSLQHALLPSTKVSVHAVDVTLPLKVSVSARPVYPYVSTLELSLADAPECNVRITPLSGESGLRGVDVGSLPVIREWVKDAIRETLSEYVTPHYIAIDVAGWFNSIPACRPTGIPTRSLADITQLRQKTRALVNPNPRTASPEGVAITSIAETLPSHRSATGTAFVQDGRPAAFDASKNRKEFHSLIKPTTELSKQGMDRFIEKLHEKEMAEQSPHDGLATLFARPLAMLSPFLVAVAASIFTKRLSGDKE